MKIEDNRVVALEMTVTGEDGTLVDEAGIDEPFEYLHGFDNLFPKLEEALLGKTVSDTLSLLVTPEDAYGERDEELVSTLPASQFQGVDEVHVGMMFQADTDQGFLTLLVTEVNGDEVTVDGNHPFAGKTLTFDIKVIGIREATPEELSHGHPHGDGGCGHTH